MAKIMLIICISATLATFRDITFMEDSVRSAAPNEAGDVK